MTMIPNDTQNEYNEFLKDKLIIPKPDSVVTSIIHKFSERAKMGKEKYGQTLDRDDVGMVEWITHFQEELMDGILYAEKLKQRISLIEKDLKNLKDTLIKDQEYETASSIRLIERKIIFGED